MLSDGAQSGRRGTELFEKEKNRRAKRFRRRPVAFAVLGAALMMASPFVRSACAQNAAPAAPATAQPAAPSAATPAPETAPSNPIPAPSVSPNAAAPAATDQPVGQTAIGRAQLPQDLSPWGMFQDADRLVKVVLIGLAFASLVTWTVWLAKMVELRTARREVRDGLRILANAA